MTPARFGNVNPDYEDRRFFLRTVMGFWYRGAYYSWGGGDANLTDCSGLPMEGFKTIGFYKRRVDRTARGIFADMVSLGRDFDDDTKLSPGCLVFYAPRETRHKIYHVEIYIGHGRTVGASGGGSKTLTKADAIRDNAFVKVRPIREPRPDESIFFADPFKGSAI